MQLLADELVALGLVESISTESVRQALKKTASGPGSSTPAAPPDAEFVWRMEDVIQNLPAPVRKIIRLRDKCCSSLWFRPIRVLGLATTPKPCLQPDLRQPTPRKGPSSQRLTTQMNNLAYDPSYPVVCFDEACQQLFGEVRPVQRFRRGRPGWVDYEYERKGVCHQFMMCEPLRGWRHVLVSERRTRRDYAGCIRDLVEVHDPRATKIRLVQDNRNTHDGASLHEAFPPAEARRIRDRIEFHYTPKHGIG